MKGDFQLPFLASGAFNASEAHGKLLKVKKYFLTLSSLHKCALAGGLLLLEPWNSPKN
jgi:hypothetical protein